MMPFDIRVGQGYDVHALVPGRKLILGGVHIPHDRGLLGHSDADALLHAITDALFGAAEAAISGGISRTPMRSLPAPTAACCCVKPPAACARPAMRSAMSMLPVIAQQPKLAPHIPGMVANIAEDLGIPAARCNVKAKTNLRSLVLKGGREGIVAQVAVLIWRGAAAGAQD
ncbi:2-C-methyl-D-erythritol 2,4-cyclodiphosphate synthase [Cupriavidus basilensis]